MLKKVLSYIFGILSIILLVGLILLVIFQKITFKNDKPTKIFNKYHSQVITGSMEPAIKTGYYITYSGKESYEVGDIIVFSHSGRLISHRIIEIIDDKYITKGDNNPISDFKELGYIEESDILGSVTRISSLLGMGPFLLKNRNLVVTISIILIFSLVILQILDVIRMTLKKQREDFKNKLEN